MDNVILLDEHLVPLKAVNKKNGEWIKGQWQEKANTELAFNGVHITVTLNDMKYYSQGAVNVGDKVLMTKTKLEKGMIVYIKDEEWVIKGDIDYDYLADIKEYYLQRSNKDDSKDNGPN